MNYLSALGITLPSGATNIRKNFDREIDWGMEWKKPRIIAPSQAQSHGLFIMCSPLAHSPPTFVAVMTTYYFTTIEEALRRVKTAVKTLYPGSYYGGITLRSGRRGFAIYQEGRIVEQYTATKDR